MGNVHSDLALWRDSHQIPLPEWFSEMVKWRLDYDGLKSDWTVEYNSLPYSFVVPVVLLYSICITVSTKKSIK